MHASQSTTVVKPDAPTTLVVTGHTTNKQTANPSSLIVNKNKLYKRNEVGPLGGLVEVAFRTEDKVTHEWKGKKIPMGLWRQILSFFEWSYETTRSETMVHLFYHEDKGWVALVLPQAGHTGMTVELLPNHEKVAETYARLGEGWGVVTSGGYVTGILMGTVHHHCSASAFQSGTDKNDEITTEGLHITIGHVGSQKYSIDGRVSFNKTFTEANFADWFQLSPTIADLLPLEMHSAALAGTLTKKPAQITFPEWWKENVIKVERPATIGFHGQHKQYGENGYYGGDTRHQYNNGGGKKGSNKGNAYGASFWFETKMDEFCKANNTTYKEVLEKVNNIPKDYAKVIAFMIKNHRDVDEMNKDVNDILNNQAPADITTYSETEQIDALNAMYGTP
jgi:hypothetical protein